MRALFAVRRAAPLPAKVEVRDPADSGRLPRRSNRLIFVFAHGDRFGEGLGEGRGDLVERDEGSSESGGESGDGSSWRDLFTVLPTTYSETLMHFEASRRSLVEGPSDAAARAILQQAAVRQEAS